MFNKIIWQWHLCILIVNMCVCVCEYMCGCVCQLLINLLSKMPKASLIVFMLSFALFGPSHVPMYGFS